MTASKPLLDRRAIVCGGGIGGLASALGLARKGIASIVLEQAAQFGEIGAGIQLGPNAFHAFDWLGVGDAARARAVYVDRLVLMDALDDAPIADLPVDEPFRTRFGNPYAVVHRAELHGVLVEACVASPLIEMRTDARVVGYGQAGETVTARLADGTGIDGGLLVGADGLHSAIRAQLVGDGAPRVSGHTTYRSVIPTGQMPEELRWNAMIVWAGPKCHIVHYPLSGWKLFNLVATCHDDAPEAVSGLPVDKAEMRRGFEHVADRPLGIIDRGENWKQWVLCDREPTEAWVDGRVVLLGDAAHPTLQYMAQGACMALEDAVCLSHKLEAHAGDVDAALEAYRLERIPRTARIQIGSRLMGDHIFHPSGARRMMRNAIMRAKTTEDYYDDLQWLYGGTGLGGIGQ